MTANAIAYLALAVWPLLSLALFALFRPFVACTLVLVGGVMFLPPVASFDGPLIPPLDKSLIPGASALLGCAIFAPRTLLRARIGRGWDLLVLAMVIGAFLTMRTNRDAIAFGRWVLPGQTFYDFASDAVAMIIQWWFPFFLGRAVLRRPEDLRSLLLILAGAGVLYSLFIWVEIRMSPQMNNWIYGFHQSDFIQTLRFGGYRPKVFMRHGLNVALFMVVALIAAAALARSKLRIGPVAAKHVAWYLLLVLVACKSSGALVYAALLLPLVVFASPSRQAKLAAVVVAVMFSYPLLRWMGWVPVEALVGVLGDLFGPERAASLAYRFENEQIALTRAVERLWFGWGLYGRQFPHDLYSGQKSIVVDGLWVLSMGTHGLVGYLLEFGLLVLPVWYLRKHLPNLDPTARIHATALALIGALYVTDLIPNSSVDPYLTFIAGVLAGLGKVAATAADARQEQEALHGSGSAG